jgi:predicted Zn-dependent peptidase
MNDDLARMMEQDFEENQATSVEKIDQNGLTSVAGLARLIRDTEATVEKLEESLKTCKKDLQKLTDEEMPAMLAEMGISSFSLDDGSTVQVKQTYGASILVKNRPDAYNWLRDNPSSDFTRICERAL